MTIDEARARLDRLALDPRYLEVLQEDPLVVPAHAAAVHELAAANV